MGTDEKLQTTITMDDSTPEGTHPLEIADHALALIDEYQDDPHVGWSTEKSVDGQPWEGA